ncbi:2-amino-4-hydroxy-6-hydroxymethyldihydropteridinediphosphokinase [Pseudorhizobium endolithicum]|uniref:2-amino-4-hydroxy-6-hydroxymethyldihydropteridine pyrophosphokinase n=1 Tax=Pseudorhizobium endolithicum TaxID=1191678 RepID=A0ABN7JV36_9HYPH|nr:2-amino-4-hydroxy-6-hydroxymethyldihydropteridine diphosphokinase [Pseudorhizobium endolithicum]CAD7045363.1 2-amino-4-hydroxy-6-hydroxymethyldihydropteridinediphosphokinase [Pseudorhizobium endolithicum]
MTAKAALGLGGNIGDPPAAMAQALRCLDERADCRIEAVSRLYQTPPWGKTDQADFFNCCAVIATSLEPEELLDVCLSIERGMKRERLERWGPRTIDIDILAYEGRQAESDRLTLPHPRMTERSFVLMPLADIAPKMRIGVKTVSEWLETADTSGIQVVGETGDWWRQR